MSTMTGGGVGGALIRVKRHINEEPLTELIVNCKKRKINVELQPEEISLAASTELSISTTTNELIISDKPLPQSDEISNNILTFAGTIENKSDIRAHLKNIAKEIVTNKRNLTENIVESARAEQRERCQENTQNQRFKVVNCYRAGLLIKPTITDDADHDDDDDDDNDQNNNDENLKKEQQLNEFTVVDIEKQSIKPIDNDDAVKDEDLTLKSSSTMVDKSSATFLIEPINPANDKYVFDIYYISRNQTCDDDRNLIDEILCCEEIQQNMQQQQLAMNGDDDDEHLGNESEDSNDEMNWRNDYPDSDNSEKSYMGDMRRALSDSDFDQNASSVDEDELVFGCEEYIDEYVRHYSYDSDYSD